MADFVATTTPEMATGFGTGATSLWPPAGQPMHLMRRQVVQKLRERSPGGLRSAVRPLLDLQERLLEDYLAGTLPINEMRRTLVHLQNTIVQTLAMRYDALDTAASKSELPFAEIDHGGDIVYANAALAQQLPEPVGRNFASLFGRRTQEVSELLRHNECASLRVEMECEGLLRQFRAEIGPLLDEDGKSGHYALLLSLRAEELRLDAALDAIIRTDLAGRIVFANNKALELLQVPRANVLDTDLCRWLAPRCEGKGAPVQQRIETWIAATEAIADNDLALTGAGQAHPINAASVPVYDGPEKRSGVLITFRDAAEDLAREALRDLLRREIDWRELMREAMRIVRTVVPYDLATFGTYSNGGRTYRAQIVEPEPAWLWGTRWFDVSDEALAWLEGDQTWSDNATAMATEDQKSDPVVIAVQREGLRNMVCLPIRGTGGKFRSVICLLSKEQKYGAGHLRALRDLGLEEVFLVAQAAMERHRDERLQRLKRKLRKAPTVRALAEILAKGVVKCFGWEYAALFRVDRKTGHFQLFEQWDKSPNGSLSVTPDYSQGLDKGMLGHCYSEGKVLVLPRVKADKARYDYIQTAEQESAMTIPLRLNDRIEFILDIESSQENAFAGSDKRLAEALAVDCEQILASRWLDAIGYSLMDTIEQAAVIVDDIGSIRRLNAAARNMLGGANGIELEHFGAEPEDKRILGQSTSYEPARVVLSTGPGVRILTQASQQPLHDDYGHRLWLFSNLAERSRELDRSFLEEAVNEVARQTRAPLMIADGLLRGAAELLRNPHLVGKCADLLDRAANQLLKADLTYDRLSESLTARSVPIDARRPFDVVELLRQTVARLPADDRKQTDCHGIPDDLVFPVDGWPDRIGYALRSILGFLLMSGRGARIAVAASLVEGGPGDTGRDDTGRDDTGRGDTGLWLHITLSVRSRGSAVVPVDEPPDEDPIAQGKESARRLVTLSPEAVKNSIDLHHGELVMPRPDDLEMAFVIMLPRIAGGRR